MGVVLGILYLRAIGVFFHCLDHHPKTTDDWPRRKLAAAADAGAAYDRGLKRVDSFLLDCAALLDAATDAVVAWWKGGC